MKPNHRKSTPAERVEAREQQDVFLARQQGWNAFGLGKNLEDCPYNTSTPAGQAWTEGYQEAVDEDWGEEA